MTDEIRRGEHAARLLTDDVLKAAFENLDAAYVKAWRAGQTMEAREEAHRMLTALAKLQADLKSMVMTGRITDERIRELTGKKRFWG